MNGDEVTISEETETMLRKRAASCRLCAEILHSWQAHGKLVDSAGMSVNVQVEHIRREQKSAEERKERDAWRDPP